MKKKHKLDPEVGEGRKQIRVETNEIKTRKKNNRINENKTVSLKRSVKWQTFNLNKIRAKWRDITADLTDTKGYNVML